MTVERTLLTTAEAAEPIDLGALVSQVVRLNQGAFFDDRGRPRAGGIDRGTAAAEFFAYHPPEAALAPAPVSGVYFIQGDGGGLIKIGVSSDVEARLRQHQAGCPVILRRIGLIVDANALEEARLHERFAHLREHGEWFRPEPDLLAFIADLPGATT